MDGKYLRKIEDQYMEVTEENQSKWMSRVFFLQ